MSDVFTQAKRSEVMSRIRGRGNKDTELALAMLLRRHRITGWLRHVEIRGRAALLRDPNFTAARQRRPTRTFSVRPDFVFRQVRLALFVDGCFWHGCPKHCNPLKWLKKSSMPANNPPSPKGGLRRTGRAFWRRKLSANVKRDALVTRMLRRDGWRVLRVWEHELARKNQERLVRRIQRVVCD